ncbi:MAG: response regulator [Cyanobacteria bacterium P01_C01_bin.70]
MEEKVINILLVEDDEVDVMNVQRAFKRNRITNPLFVAGNGLEALAMLRGQSETGHNVPDTRRIVLLDINMPKMNGIEFLQALRQDSHLAMTPVVVLTTSDEDQDRIEAYKLNVAGYILKPVTFSSFAEVMAALNRYWTLCEMP